MFTDAGLHAAFYCFLFSGKFVTSNMMNTKKQKDKLVYWKSEKESITCFSLKKLCANIDVKRHLSSIVVVVCSGHVIHCNM